MKGNPLSYRSIKHQLNKNIFGIFAWGLIIWVTTTGDLFFIFRDIDVRDIMPYSFLILKILAAFCLFYLLAQFLVAINFPSSFRKELNKTEELKETCEKIHKSLPHEIELYSKEFKIHESKFKELIEEEKGVWKNIDKMSGKDIIKKDTYLLYDYIFLISELKKKSFPKWEPRNLVISFFIVKFLILNLSIFVMTVGIIRTDTLIDLSKYFSIEGPATQYLIAKISILLLFYLIFRGLDRSEKLVDEVKQ